MLSSFHPHLLWYFIFGSPHEETNLFIFSPKFLCKDEIVNQIKIKNA